MQEIEMRLVELKGRDKMIGVCHPLRWIEELVKGEFRGHLRELLREESQVEEDN